MKAGVASNPEIKAAYDDVRNDKTPTSWVVLGYAADNKDELVVEATGGEDSTWEEFCGHFRPESAQFGYFRFVLGNDELSQRAKFVLVSWCGENVKVMRKAKLSVHIAEVKKVIPVFAIEVAASSVEQDLDKDKITLLLKKAMGANYDRQASNY